MSAESVTPAVTTTMPSQVPNVSLVFVGATMTRGKQLVSNSRLLPSLLLPKKNPLSTTLLTSDGKEKGEPVLGPFEKYPLSQSNALSCPVYVQWGVDRNMEFIWWLANRLTSYDEEMHKEILDDFFTDDAKYVSLVVVCIVAFIFGSWLIFVLLFFNSLLPMIGSCVYAIIHAGLFFLRSGRD